MIERPEAFVLEKQLRDAVLGKPVARVVIGATPHAFFFCGENASSEAAEGLLCGKAFTKAESHGMYLTLHTDGAQLVMGDGIQPRFNGPEEKKPDKHQLYVEFEDGSALTARVALYGGAWVHDGRYTNPYIERAYEAPDVLGAGFDAAYFDRLLGCCKPTVSMKAALATEQRIPGLGNGVLQDILLNARLHPKTKLGTLTDPQREALFVAVKTTLTDMAAAGGRHVEKDLFGEAGKYTVKLAAGSEKAPCPICGGRVEKKQYLGGSVYTCATCQPAG